MTSIKEPKFLNDREFADVIKNAPLVSIDLIIQDRKGRVLLQHRHDRPAKGYWFVPGGRIRKYESIHDSISRIYKDELQKTFPNLEIDPKKCHLLNVYEHFYEKDNKYTENDSISDMKHEDTYYVSIAYEYKTDYFDSKQGPSFKWFTFHELVYEYSSVHKYTKEFFTRNFHTPNDSELYSALMAHYIHYDKQFWSRTQIILAIQGAAFVGAYTMSGTLFPSIIMLNSAVLIFMVWLLIHRDINNSRVNEEPMDRIAARLFSYYGPFTPKLRPISLREEPIRKWLTGSNIIHAITLLLILFDLALGCFLYENPNFFRKLNG